MYVLSLNKTGGYFKCKKNKHVAFVVLQDRVYGLSCEKLNNLEVAPLAPKKIANLNADNLRTDSIAKNNLYAAATTAATEMVACRSFVVKDCGDVDCNSLETDV